jgi:hypothetical protein
MACFDPPTLTPNIFFRVLNIPTIQWHNTSASPIHGPLTGRGTRHF